MHIPVHTRAHTLNLTQWILRPGGRYENEHTGIPVTSSYTPSTLYERHILRSSLGDGSALETYSWEERWHTRRGESRQYKGGMEHEEGIARHTRTQTLSWISAIVEGAAATIGSTPSVYYTARLGSQRNSRIGDPLYPRHIHYRRVAIPNQTPT